MRANNKRVWFLGIVASVLCLPSVSASAQVCPPESVATVTIDHETGSVKPDGVLRLRRNARFCIEIVNTQPACFLYNLREVDNDSNWLTVSVLPPRTTERFVVIHDGETDEYVIEITKKSPLPDACKSETLLALERSIRIENYGWTLGFAGAYTLDQLTDPVYFLEPGTREKPGGMPGEMEEGFFVRRRGSAEDSWERGAATMIHLHHNGPGRQRWDVHWVPLSFGLGVAGESESKYFVGSGMRFGTKAFLTLGWVFGEETRLPAKLGLDDFTTAGDALDTLPTGDGDAFFFGLSYTFAGLDVDRLSSRFKVSTPALQEAN